MSARSSFFAKFIAALILGLVVTFVIDPLDTSTLSTPFCLAIVLMGVSLRQSTMLVVAVSFIYVALATYASIHFYEFYSTHVHASPHPFFWFFQRLGIFLIVCAMAVHMAYYRTNTEKAISDIRNVLGKLPAPVMISDAAGFITYTNEALNAAFKQSAQGIVGKRYVDLFMTDIQEGKAMRYYIELFGAQANSVHEIDLRPFGDPVPISARLTCMGAGSNRVMITVLPSLEEKADILK